jgi:DNA-binding NarL/FixJ family response regulator
VPITVLLVDDQDLYRGAIRAHLDHAPGIAVVAEAVDGPSAVRLAVELRPEVVVMDLSLPGFDGIEATRRIKQAQPGIGVVALSGYADDEDTRRETIEAGAAVLLDKASALDELVPAIRAAVAAR